MVSRPEHNRAADDHWGAPICHPLPVAAVLLLAVNDHWIKGSGLLPGAVTGKLSDVAGLFFFPALVLACARGLAAISGPTPRRWVRRPLFLWAIVAATGGLFAAANLDRAFNGWLASWVGHKVLDPTDLLALPALFVGGWWLRRFVVPVPRQAAVEPSLQLPALLAALLATAATSPPPVVFPRDYARWHLEPAEAAHTAGPLRLAAWVSKSGKSGFGLSLCLYNGGERAIDVSGITARATVGGERLVARAKRSRRLAVRQSVAVYLPLPFDNQAAWNAGRRSGTLQLALEIDRRARRFVWPLTQDRPSYHRTVYRAPHLRAAQQRRGTERGASRTPPEREASSACRPPVR